MRRVILHLAACAGVLLATSVPAAAIVSLTSIQASSNYPGIYEWSYTATFDATDGMDGAYFTLYDWDADVFTIAPSTSWSVSQSFLGTTPSGLNPADDPAIRNITFLSGLNRPGTTFFFRIFSSVNTSAVDDYTWFDKDAYPNPANGQSGSGSIAVARRTSTDPGGGTDVPEPGTLALLGLGLIGLLVSRRTESA